MFRSLRWTLALIWKALFQNSQQSWAFFGQIARIISALTFLGILARTLTPDFLANWYVFGAMFGFASLAEMGLGQVFSRHVAYKNKSLEQEYISKADFVKFIRQGETYYHVLAVVVFILAWAGGTWWLIHKNYFDFNLYLLFAWFLYSAGGAISILSIFYAAVLSGSGELSRTYQVAVLTSIANTILLLIILFKNSLIVPVCAFLFSQLAGLFLLKHKMNSMHIMEQISGAVLPVLEKSAFKDIKIDVSKMLLGMVSYQALTGGFVLILSNFFTNAEIASYGLTMQFSGFVQSIAMIWVGTAFYEMARAYKSNDPSATRKIFWTAFWRSAFISLIGMIGIFILGPVVLNLLSSKNSLFESFTLGLLVIDSWIEFTLSLFTQFLISQGNLSVVYYSLFGSIIICSVTAVLSLRGYGLDVLFISRLLCFLLFMGLPFILMSRKLFDMNVKIFYRENI